MKPSRSAAYVRRLVRPHKLRQAANRTTRRVLQLFRKLFPQAPPRPWRPPWLPDSTALRRESDIHLHSPEERADLFLAADSVSTEVEILNFLHASICLLKPKSVLETGIGQGLGTIALASACRDNGFGHVHSIDIDPRACARVSRAIRAHGLSQFSTQHCSDSLAFLRETDLTFDFALFDSLPALRFEEYRLCRERHILHGTAAFHDTSPYRTLTIEDPDHASYRSRLLELAADAAVETFMDVRLSRGVVVVRHRDAGTSTPNQPRQLA